MVLHLVKPFVYVWAGLTILDDLSIVIKIARLAGASTFNPQSQNHETMCNLCDDVMERILIGKEGLEAVPCSWICLGVPKCTNMCETIQQLSEKSGEFPCVKAGYCLEGDDEREGVLDEIDCKKGPLFSCEPTKFCRKKRSKFGLKYTCDLK